MKKPPASPPREPVKALRPPGESYMPRILVVEDDEDIRRINVEVLEQCGYRVDEAENGAIAWEALNTRGYDLMITDNSMPVMSGMELLKKMHAAHMVVPVIMASGTMPWRELTGALWLQPSATLVKPYSFSELLGVVITVLPAGHVMPPPAVIAPPVQQRIPAHGKVSRRKVQTTAATVRQEQAASAPGGMDAFAG